MTGQLALSMPSTVQSVVRCQANGPLIAAAAQLRIDDDDLVLDVTYGLGKFWTRYRPQCLIAHDLATDGVDFRHLPEADASIDVVVFDPPYIPQGGRETSTLPRSTDGTRANVRTSAGFLKRYGLVDVPRTVAELEQLIADGMTECTRVLRPKGRLLVKCMDYVVGGRFRKGNRHVVTVAEDVLGLVQVDELIHYSGLGPGNLYDEDRQQQHSRRAHSFLCVFQKPARWEAS